MAVDSPRASRARSLQGAGRFAVVAIVLAVVTWYLFNIGVHAHPAVTSPFWAWFGVVAVAALWLIGAALTGTWNPLALAMGADNRLSTSKFQVLLWTATVGFVYVMYYADRVLSKGAYGTLTQIPPNVLIALGISVTTATAAKAITGSQAAANPDNKPAIAMPSYDPSALVRNDDASTPSLTKVQILFWTLVAVVVYFITAFHRLADIAACDPTADPLPKTCALPDIDTALMIFMGLGHATYLGGKLTTPQQPTLSGVKTTKNPASATGYSVALSGSNLGSSPGAIAMNGAAIAAPANLCWTPTLISFDLPQMPDPGWAAGTTAIFVVTVDGTASGPITYTYP